MQIKNCLKVSRTKEETWLPNWDVHMIRSLTNTEQRLKDWPKRKPTWQTIMAKRFVSINSRLRKLKSKLLHKQPPEDKMPVCKEEQPQEAPQELKITSRDERRPLTREHWLKLRKRLMHSAKPEKWETNLIERKSSDLCPRRGAEVEQGKATKTQMKPQWVPHL